MIIHGPNTEQRTIGGKASGLYRLQALGMPVPPFVVIPAETFDLILAATDAHGQRQKLLTFVLSEFGPDYPRPYPDQLAVSPAGRCGALIGGG